MKDIESLYKQLKKEMKEKAQQVAELKLANHKLVFQNEEKRKRVSEPLETKRTSIQDIQEVFQGAENLMYRHNLPDNSSMRSKTIDLIMNTLYEKNPREMRHSIRVSQICEKIATYLGLSVSDIHDLKIAGLMHDIGKIGIDESILNKPGKLNPLEWAMVKKHPEVGYRILGSSQEFSEIADCILEHHEHWDGNGYPKGLKGNNILLYARIIGIADAFDAMTTDRTYRKKATVDEAFREIQKCAGSQFDPIIAQVFVDHYSE